MFFKLLINNIALWSAMAFYMPFIGAFYRQRGLSVFQIGLLTTLGSFASIFIQPIWAYLSDKTQKRRTIFVVLAFCDGAAVLLYYAATSFGQHYPAYIFPAFLTVALIVVIFNSALLPLSDTLITGHAQNYNLDFAKIRIGGTVGFAVVVFGIGTYLRQNPMSMFIFGSCGFVTLGLLMLMLPPLPSRVPAPEKSGTAPASPGPPWRGVFRSKDVFFVLLLIMIMQVGLVFHSSFIGAFVIDLGYNQFYIGLISTISALSEVPVLLVIRRAQRRFGYFSLLVFACFMMALRLFMVSSGIMPVILASQLLQSVSYMICYYCGVMYVRENVLPGRESQGQSVLVMCQTGIGTVLGSGMGGLVSNRIGLHWGFRLYPLILILLCMVVVFCYSKMQVSQVKRSAIK